ncbi:hypothetical protein BDM02DRAFT_3183804 [Thelephora ganbajun]|uniref:Uncharacterized protein n=1 Tax=Thelephora ganbajun TaxID=370292 RepID=A0ACB6ZSL9_THEGA|nr:hypothetical protein BDM02DRAFT_3183804 [Thelephora ganbajun]
MWSLKRIISWVGLYKYSDASKSIVDRVEEPHLHYQVGQSRGDEALKTELTDEDLKYLEEPHKPNPVMGRT